MEQRPFLSVSEIAGILDIDPRTVHKLIRDKLLPAHKIGKEYRVAREDFEIFMRETRTTKNEGDLALAG